MIKIDFDRFNEIGLKPIIRRLEKGGLEVASVDANNRGRRESGFLVKAAKIIFDSGQVLLLKAKAGGSIYQARLNNKVLAVKHVDNLDKAMKEIVDYVKRNEPAYERAQKRKAARAAKQAVKLQMKTAVKTTANQLKQYQEQMTGLTSEIQELENDVSSLDTTIEERSSTMKELQDELNAEIERGERLEAELAELKEVA